MVMPRPRYLERHFITPGPENHFVLCEVQPLSARYLAHAPSYRADMVDVDTPIPAVKYYSTQDIERIKDIPRKDIFQCRACNVDISFVALDSRERSPWEEELCCRTPITANMVPVGEFKVISGVLGFHAHGLGDQVCDQVCEIWNLHTTVKLSVLESGDLASMLAVPGLRPRTLTITMRLGDQLRVPWNSGESIKGTWIERAGFVMPDTVRMIRIELEGSVDESLHIDRLLQLMRDCWFFKRADGTAFFAESHIPATHSTVMRPELADYAYAARRYQLVPQSTPDRPGVYTTVANFYLEETMKRANCKVSRAVYESARDDVFPVAQFNFSPHFWQFYDQGPGGVETVNMGEVPSTQYGMDIDVPKTGSSSSSKLGSCPFVSLHDPCVHVDAFLGGRCQCDIEWLF